METREINILSQGIGGAVEIGIKRSTPSRRERIATACLPPWNTVQRKLQQSRPKETEVHSPEAVVKERARIAVLGADALIAELDKAGGGENADG